VLSVAQRLSLIAAPWRAIKANFTFACGLFSFVFVVLVKWLQFAAIATTLAMVLATKIQSQTKSRLRDSWRYRPAATWRPAA
jgi:hypothetical protein